MIFIHKLLDPAVIIACAIILFFVISLYRKKCICWSITLLIIYFLFTTPLLSNYLIGSIEIRKSNLDSCLDKNVKYRIVILGGGLKAWPSSADQIELLNIETFRRVIGGYRVYFKNPTAGFVVAGGLGGAYKEADLMKSLLVKLGVDPDLIIIDDISGNTHENAVNVKHALGGFVDIGLVLVTSAYHMNRAVSTFRNQGMVVCAQPVDHQYVKQRYQFALIPQVRSLRIWAYFLHETIGTIYYRFQGYI